MLGIFIYDFLFFVIPLLVLVYFGISLFRFVYALKKNKTAPETYSEEEIKKRKLSLIVSSVTLGVLLAIVIGLIALLYMAVAFM